MSAQTDSNLTREQMALSIPEPEAAEHARRVARELSFATDRELAQWLRPAEVRLKQVENGIAHFRAMIPSLERECAAIRQNISAVLQELEPSP